MSSRSNGRSFEEIPVGEVLEGYIRQRVKIYQDGDPIPVESSESIAANIGVNNLSMPTANTEYSLALESGIRQLTVRSRITSTMKIAFVSGETTTNFITLEPGAVLVLDKMKLTGKTIYISSNVDSNTAEIIQQY